MSLRLIPPGEIAAILLVVTHGLVGERDVILPIVTPWLVGERAAVLRVVTLGLECGIKEGSTPVVQASPSSDLVFL
jgi:hypothetical protein